MAFLPHREIALYSSSTAGDQSVRPVLMRHADKSIRMCEKKKESDSVLESRAHILAALYSGKDQTNMSFRYLHSLKHTHTHRVVPWCTNVSW